MKNNRKKTIAIILMIVVLLLGGAGVYVTYLLQRAPVPTAPTSIPRAAEWYGGQSCNVSFAITVEATPTPACRVSCTTEGAESGNYKCEGGVWRNKACSTTDDSSCVCPVTVTVTTTTTPGVPNPCNGDCGSDSNCQTGLICYDAGVTGKHCRNPQNPTSETCAAPTTTPTATVTATPTVTGTVTTTVTQTVAPTGTGTVAPTAVVTATPTEEILYETGILNLPGAAAFGGGLLLVVLGILFAL